MPQPEAYFPDSQAHATEGTASSLQGSISKRGSSPKHEATLTGGWDSLLPDLETGGPSVVPYNPGNAGGDWFSCCPSSDRALTPVILCSDIMCCACGCSLDCRDHACSGPSLGVCTQGLTQGIAFAGKPAASAAGYEAQHYGPAAQEDDLPPGTSQTRSAHSHGHPQQ